MDSDHTAANDDISAHAHVYLADGSITTEGKTDRIADIATLRGGSDITDSGDAVPNASTVMVTGAHTEDSSNYALWVDHGITRLDGDVHLVSAQKLYPDGGAEPWITNNSVNKRIAPVAGSATAFRADTGATRFVGAGTTASLANVHMQGGDGNELLRSTSSIAVKKIVRRLDAPEAQALIHGVVPSSDGAFSYKSKLLQDDPETLLPGLRRRGRGAGRPRPGHAH